MTVRAHSTTTFTTSTTLTPKLKNFSGINFGCLAGAESPKSLTSVFYSVVCVTAKENRFTCEMVLEPGLEPGTEGLENLSSIQLSYSSGHR